MALRFVIPDAIERQHLSDEDRCRFLQMQMDNKVEYLCGHGCCEIYGKPIRNKAGVVIFMRYWGIYQGNIYSLGSGGYIPEFHPKDSRIYEFFLKTYDISKLSIIEEKEVD